jgi:hypothetical protein
VIDKVAVLIPCYNDAYTLRFCLESLAGQVDEVIVLDDASTDETPDVVLDARQRFQDVSLIRQKEQLGWAGARRRLLAECDARHVFMFNADDVLGDAAMLRAMVASKYPYVQFPFCVLFGDLQHSILRLRHYVQSEVYIDRRWAPKASWADSDCPANIPRGHIGHWAPGVLTFHMQDIKPDARLVERGMFRKWLAAGRPGTSAEFCGLADMPPDEIHRQAFEFLMTAGKRVPIRTWDAAGNPLWLYGTSAVKPPALPPILKKALPGRFQFVYEDGRIVDRVDTETRT